ncbi:hypothetical protein [Segatella maculosa]|uniref:hypothetical protein n=1 Tax=Segatella maculosa TaxID=439703 RepID=UPI00036FA990|nr:hypothetical protein [Segatella maculosa]
MMNIKQNKGLFALLLLAVLTACTSEDNITTSKQLIEVGGDKLKIVINEEPFDVETTTQTRAGGMAQAIPAGTVDLGDGLEAEVSISQGTPAPKTRATVVSDGHYNIYAYDANTNQMLIGPNKKLSGNVVGGVFTPDAGSRLELEAGTYKFVCCTDNIHLNDTYGTGSLYPSENWNAISITNEMAGATEQTISGDDDQIVFLMHHRSMRFRFRTIAYTNQLTDVKFKLLFDSQSNYYTYINIPTGFQGPGTSMSAPAAVRPYTLPSTPTRVSPTYPLANEFLSDYKYLSPPYAKYGGVGGFTFELSGTIYGKTVNKTVDCTFDPAIGTIENGSYTINLKLKPTPALYLFEDGTCGALAEKGSRTPIAAVVKEKTATEDGLAIALKDDASDGIGTVKWGGPSGETTQQFNHIVKSTVADVLADMDGYKYTWEAAGSLDGVTIKANNPNMDAFYKAANHTSPAPITFGGGKRGKWFLPSLGQWVLALKALGKTTTLPTDLVSSGSSTTTGNVDINYLNSSFTAAGVGGNKLDNYWYWTSTQYHTLEACSIDLANGGTNTFRLTSEPTGRTGECVRAFIHF